ncbi:MAG: hypothetical protein LBQ20_08940 [Rhodanobacter sp.]|jgi:hypothetical protein|nr:hypothetical protein [Rhodanobacter sp.]
MKRIIGLLLLLALGGCGNHRHIGATRSVSVPATAVGTFDNHEQVSRERAGTALPPHVVATIEPTAQPDWAIWRIHVGQRPELDVLWAMHAVDGGVFVPHRALIALPATGASFDPKQWTPLDACALRGTVAATGFKVAADAALCAALIPGIGAQAPWLPLAAEREGEWLHLRLYVDQARGADAREDLRKVVIFSGWAAINGAGPAAAADNTNWHMDRAIRIGSEGGRVPLTWRDGSASGYSLGLERMTYREGNMPVLKLSVIDERNGSTLAYAWANPEATRIGINLGWVQVGLQREGESDR